MKAYKVIYRLSDGARRVFRTTALDGFDATLRMMQSRKLLSFRQVRSVIALPDELPALLRKQAG